jgi:excisionase family DNA binding protein
MSRRRFVTLVQAAEVLGCSERSVRNYIGEGYFPAYKRPGVRGYLVDQAEVDAWVATNPPGVSLGVTRFGPKARIVQLPPLAVNADGR